MIGSGPQRVDDSPKLWFVLDRENENVVWFVKAATYLEAVAKVTVRGEPLRPRDLMSKGLFFDDDGVCEIEMPNDRLNGGRNVQAN